MFSQWIPRSLKARLLIASFILLPLIIAVAGYALQNAFSFSLQASLEKRLRLQAYLMIGSADIESGKLVISDIPQQLNTVDQIYTFIHTRSGLLQWASPLSKKLPPGVMSVISNSRLSIGETLFTHFDEGDYYLYQYPVDWDDAGVTRHYLFSVVETGSELTAELNAYKAQLWGWLVAVTVLALLLQSFITLWGLKPLAKLLGDLHNIERGRGQCYASRPIVLPTA